jgi:hypothetical protein
LQLLKWLCCQHLTFAYNLQNTDLQPFVNIIFNTIQWGIAVNTANATSSFTFPITYTSKHYISVLSGYQATGNTQAYATINSKSLSGGSWTAFCSQGGVVPKMSSIDSQVQAWFLSIGI